jgi:hypothetical protein
VLQGPLAPFGLGLGVHLRYFFPSVFYKALGILGALTWFLLVIVFVFGEGYFFFRIDFIGAFGS